MSGAPRDVVGVLGGMGPAGELSLNLAKAGTKGLRQSQAIEKAGSLLRRAREGAGMTTKELGKVIDLDDPHLLEQAERGKAALPMEVILRLASALGRHDPVTFAIKLSLTYNPLLWKALDELGIDRMVALVGQGGRGRRAEAACRDGHIGPGTPVH